MQRRFPSLRVAQGLGCVWVLGTKPPRPCSVGGDFPPSTPVHACAATPVAWRHSHADWRLGSSLVAWKQSLCWSIKLG